MIENRILVNNIVYDGRLRKEMGNIDELAASIKEFGLIQPIVIANIDHDITSLQLVAGGRRLSAVKKLGWLSLLHGRDFIYREELENEDKKIRLQAVELEENLRRKQLTWQEEIEGKQRLLAMMQSIHGVARMGAPTKSEKRAGVIVGFGVNKLAAMLGESNAQTSKDLELASLVEKFPHLKKADTKESARRQINILGAIATMSLRAAAAPQAGETASLWKLYEGDFKDNISNVADDSVDLVYTDLPFGVSLQAMSKHGGASTINYLDDRKAVVSQLGLIAREAFRVLCNDRFAIFFFGFNYYTELVLALELAGFRINPVPIVWYKHTRSTENPNTRYANAYDPALIAMKGSPVFIRPGQTNVVDIPAIAPSEKLQIAQQPVALVQRFIEDMTSHGAQVLDFCAGSGTTGEAAIRTKRRVILFEREAAACTVIKARLSSIK